MSNDYNDSQVQAMIESVELTNDSIDAINKNAKPAPKREPTLVSEEVFQQGFFAMQQPVSFKTSIPAPDLKELDQNHIEMVKAWRKANQNEPSWSDFLESVSVADKFAFGFMDSSLAVECNKDGANE